MTRRRIALYLGGIGLLLVLLLLWYVRAIQLDREKQATRFAGQNAYSDVMAQVAFGPRVTGSPAQSRAVEWMQAQLRSAGWQVRLQRATSMGHPIENVVAYRSDLPPQLILGAHYDSRMYADRDPDPAQRVQPVPGADDGASGVAVLLELARTLPNDTLPLWIVLFDAEDNGNIPGWDWLLGSKAFVALMTAEPRAMILVDMVGQANLEIPMESYSDVDLSTSVWNAAARLGYGNVFVPQTKYRIEDDHLPFIQAGIPSVDIIDLDYPYWHTTADTPEHVSSQSLQVVGDVLQSWLAEQSHPTK